MDLKDILTELQKKYDAVNAFIVPEPGKNKGKVFADLFPKSVPNDRELMEALIKFEADPKFAEFEQHFIKPLKNAKDELSTQFIDGKIVDTEKYNKAKSGMSSAETNLARYLRGEEVKLKVADPANAEAVIEKSFQLKDSKIPDAFKKFEAETNKAYGILNGQLGMVRTEGWAQTVKNNGTKMKFWETGMETGARVKAFAHGSAVVGAVVGMGDALFRGKDAEGEDRSNAKRILEFVAAGGLGVVALGAGRAAVAR